MQLNWATEYPSLGSGALEFDKLTTDDAQNLYLCGGAISSINTTLYSSAILSVKFDSMGSVLWESKYDGLFSDRFSDCAVNGNNGLVVAGSRGTMIGGPPGRAEVVNYDTETGLQLWDNFIFDTVLETATVRDIDFDSDSYIYTFGVYSNDLTEYDSNKMYIAKLSPTNGETIWKRVFQQEFAAIKGKVLQDKIRIFGGRFLAPSVFVNFLIDIDLSGNTIAAVDLPNIIYGPDIYTNYFQFDTQGYLIGFGYKVYKFDVSNTPVWAFDFARGLPNMIGQAKTITSDEVGNIYASGYIQDTLTSEQFTQTIKLSPDGELIWATVDKYAEETDYEIGEAIAVSGDYVFVSSQIAYNTPTGPAPQKIDYRPILYSNLDGSILYDTLIDANFHNINYYAHYAQDHFYLLGKSYLPGSSDPDDYRYKIFKFSVEKPSVATETPVKASPVNISPNPTSGSLRIDQMEGQHFHQFFLYDAKGVQVYNEPIRNATQTLLLPSLATGVYLVKLTGAERVYTQKLVVRP